MLENNGIKKGGSYASTVQAVSDLFGFDADFCMQGGQPSECEK